MEQRLQKILAAAGYGSRRSSEELIEQGRVTVNGQVARLGQKADLERDTVAVDGQPVSVAVRKVYVAVHKPRGVLSDTEDERDRQTVRDLVSLPGHLFAIGRLDATSEGLIILTDDGDLTHRLTHPRYEHTKEYQVQVEGQPTEEVLEHWRQGVFLEGKRTVPAEVAVLRRERDQTWLRVVLREGRKRQIRRVAAMLGHPVTRLIRVAIGPVQLGELRPGEWRYLTDQELRVLGHATEAPTRLDARRPRRSGAGGAQRTRAQRTRAQGTRAQGTGAKPGGSRPGAGKGTRTEGTERGRTQRGGSGSSKRGAGSSRRGGSR
ncbi:MAG: rRNA pseudouridine synthase [Anaerolineales bacterium]|nr:rRNA pseudouridine synthase [Anaerolineales bacterium]